MPLCIKQPPHLFSMQRIPSNLFQLRNPTSCRRKHGKDTYAGDQAQSLYNSGVSAAFSLYGLDATSFIAPAGAYAYPVAGSLDDKIDAIITQKWASLPGSHALEAWFERNRTGFPKSSPVYSTDPGYIGGQFVISAASVLGDAYPKRIVYPDVERSRNSNTPPQVPITTPVWWGK